MAKQRFINNFDFQFITSIKATATSGIPESELGYGILQINSSASAVLPALTNDDWYILTAFKKTGSVQSAIEIIKVLGVNEPAYVAGGETRIRVERGQEGTVPQAYVATDYISLRLTSAGTTNFLQATDNLNGLTDVAAARTKLGLKSGALADTGTGNTNVILGNDSRLTNSRTPTGGAGGVLSGTFPNPGFAVDMATQGELDTAIASREPSISGSTSTHVWRGNKTFSALTKSDVGLTNVDNTSNATERNAIATLVNKTLSLAENNVIIVPTGNLNSITLNNALNELQLDLDGREFNFQGNQVVAASVCNIWDGSGNSKVISGNTSITSFGTAPRVGATMKIIFADAPLLVNSLNLLLNNGNFNIQIEPRDYAIVYADTLTTFLVYVVRKSGQSISDNGLPIGTIIPYAGNTPPAGFLLCPLGATEISRSVYSALNQQQANSGYPFGAGNGVSTFIMPWIPAGFSIIQANANLGTYSSGDVRSHTHIQNAHNHTDYYQTTGVASGRNFALPTNSISPPPQAFAITSIGEAGAQTGNNGVAPGIQSTGSAHNYAAGLRINYCVKF